MKMDLGKYKNIILKNKKYFSFLATGVSLFLCLNCSDNNKKDGLNSLLEINNSSDLLLDSIYNEETNIDSTYFIESMKLVSKYIELGQHDQAIEILLKKESDLLNEENSYNEKEKFRRIYSYLGQCYISMKEFDLAINSYNKAYDIAESMGELKKQLLNLNDLAVLFSDLKNTDKNLESLQKALLLIESNKVVLDEDIIYSVYLVYLNLSNYYVYNKQHSIGKPYLIKAKKIFGEYNNVFSKREEIILISCEVDYLIKEKKYQDAINLYREALNLAEEIEHLEYQTWLLNALKNVYLSMGDYKKAYLYQTEEYKADSILFNRQSTDKIAELHTFYETDKLKSENEKKEAELIAKESQLEVQKNKNRLAWGLSTAALLMALGGAGFSYALKKKNRIITAEKAEKEQYAEEVAAINDEVMEKNEALQQANQEIKEKKAIVDQYAKDISDSIRYSVKIQGLILAQNNNIQKHFPQSWVFYKPQHIVGGDFYFANETINGKKMLLAGDCTGHGVPGGFLTIFGKIRIEQLLSCAEKPSDIITGLDTIFKDQFTSDPHNFIVDHDKGGIELRDSMEISCVFFDPETKTIEYSLTSVPIIVCRKGEIIKLNTEIRASIGSEKKNPRFTGFQTYEFQLQEGDSVYLFSDGLPDQFLGKTNKKIGSRYFYEILKQISALPVSERSMHIANIYNELMKTEEGKITRQIDDMCLVGFKV